MATLTMEEETSALCGAAFGHDTTLVQALERRRAALRQMAEQALLAWPLAVVDVVYEYCTPDYALVRRPYAGLV